jgi:cellulose synthase/poly-beta-1,6-N-acetylglucosamine synthase-like glycosyltransferase
MLVALFWSLVALLVYVYAGFTALVVLVARIRRKRVQQAEITPRLSLIIPVWNEERTIAERLDNALALDYPKDGLEIIVPSDGSTDRTEEIVKGYATRGVHLLALPRRGKIHAIKEAVAAATGELLVFSDANSMYEKSALRMLARNFADPEVGGVCGNQVYVKANKTGAVKERSADILSALHAKRYFNRMRGATTGALPDSTSEGETLYWSFDKWLKQSESLTGSIVSAHGAIYAVRRALYQHPTNAAVTDDFAISTAVIEQGYRLVFESEAIAYEEPVPAAKREFGRKVRIMNRGLRGVLLRKRLLNPLRYGFYSVVLFSHKVLRRTVPFFLLALLAVSWRLGVRSEFYFYAAAAQAIFYALAGLGYVLRGSRLGRLKFFYIPCFYCLANAAALVAFIKLFAGARIELWQPQRQGS